jgi:hypothetical protein
MCLLWQRKELSFFLYLLLPFGAPPRGANVAHYYLAK